MSEFEIIHEKLDQAVEVLKEKNIDLWITFVRETTHIADPCQDLILGLDLTWQSALMVSRTGERIAIVGRFETDSIERVGGYTTVVGYDRSIREPFLEHLARLDPRQIALNFSENDSAADGLTHGLFGVLTKLVAGTVYADRFISAEKIVGALRGRKTPAEISRIRSAIQETDAIFEHITQLLRPGVTGREIAGWFHDVAEKKGLGLSWGRDHCPAVTPGPDAPLGHTIPGDHAVQRGHLLQADFGVEKDGFVSDLQRTWYVLDKGETVPPAEVLAGWNAARSALEAGRAVLRPGVRGWEVDQAARDTLTQAGYPEYMHAFGHHVGRTAHDGTTVLGPKWERYGTSIEGVIEEGNVFAIELGVRVPGRGYIGCEEDVLVTSTGAEYLSELQTELWCI
ncbi:MAG: aminopeptidase P family protein [Chloroflexi bacterium]|nr:aminopeptidase P family protein [Chloroflexota bacterium]